MSSIRRSEHSDTASTGDQLHHITNQRESLEIYKMSKSQKYTKNRFNSQSKKSNNFLLEMSLKLIFINYIDRQRRGQRHWTLLSLMLVSYRWSDYGHFRRTGTKINCNVIWQIRLRLYAASSLAHFYGHCRVSYVVWSSSSGSREIRCRQMTEVRCRQMTQIRSSLVRREIRSEFRSVGSDTKFTALWKEQRETNRNRQTVCRQIECHRVYAHCLENWGITKSENDNNLSDHKQVSKGHEERRLDLATNKRIEYIFGVQIENVLCSQFANIYRVEIDDEDNDRQREH